MASRKRVVEDSGSEADVPKSKKAKNSTKAPVSQEMQKDDEGNPYWEISGKRRLQITEFKGVTMVGLREFYEKDGKALPGKKGIALNLEQFNAFVELLPQLERSLKEKGLDVKRPQYDAPKSDTKVQPEEEADDEVEEPPKKEATASKSKSKLDKFRLKANHEATSDEDNA